MIDRAQEYQRLAKFYRDLNEEEILKLGRDMGDLTETAQQALQAELAVRRLTIPSEEKPHVEPDTSLDPQNLGRFAGLSSRDCIWEFPETEDARAAGEMLAAAGIRYNLSLPSAERFDMGAPRLAVMPEDVERARQVLSQPIPEEFRILVRTNDQFLVPTCPKCASPDPLLEAIEPTNKWRCEVCSHVWLDTVAS